MSETAGRVADAPGNWVDHLAPAFLRPYLRLARLDRPIGAWLLLMPCWWSAGIAAVAAKAPFPNPWHVLLFFVGAFVMRFVPDFALIPLMGWFFRVRDDEGNELWPRPSPKPPETKRAPEPAPLKASD